MDVPYHGVGVVHRSGAVLIFQAREVTVHRRTSPEDGVMYRSGAVLVFPAQGDGTRVVRRLHPYQHDAITTRLFVIVAQTTVWYHLLMIPEKVENLVCRRQRGHQASLPLG